MSAKRKGTTIVVAVAISVLLAACAAVTLGKEPSRKTLNAPITKLYTCVTSAGQNELGWFSHVPTCPHTSDAIVSSAVTTYVPPTTTTSTTTTTITPTTTATPTTVGTTACVGTPLVNGQTDINNAPTGTTFCMIGVHNWTLSPKANDTISGGVLDGAHVTAHAFGGPAANVTLNAVEVRNYVPPAQSGAVQGGTGWVLKNLQVHDNGTVCATAQCQNAGGDGSDLGVAWQITGGRYYNNRQSGLAAGGAGTVIDGAEIDHNNFTDDSYTTQNVDCGFEAGGVKSIANNLTVKNSYVHDNACRGLWIDGGGNGTVFSNNRVTNNWADGLMIEISGAASITGNTVSGNGFQEFGAGKSCVWGYGSGVFISTSGQTPSFPNGPINVSGNAVSDNCQAITGVQQARGAGLALAHVHFVSNTLIASARTGAGNWFGMTTDVTGVVLANQDDTIGTNTVGAGIHSCGLTC